MRSIDWPTKLCYHVDLGWKIHTDQPVSTSPAAAVTFLCDPGLTIVPTSQGVERIRRDDTWEELTLVPGVQYPAAAFMIITTGLCIVQILLILFKPSTTKVCCSLITYTSRSSDFKALTHASPGLDTRPGPGRTRRRQGPFPGEVAPPSHAARGSMQSLHLVLIT